MRILHLILPVLLLVSACCRRSVPGQWVVKDTTVVSYIIRDTAIIAPRAEVEVWVRLDSLQDTPVIATRNQATISVRKQQGSVVARCECDTLAIAAQMKDTRVDQVRYSTEIVREVYVPAVVKTLAWLGGIGLAILVFGLIKKIW